MDDGDRARAWQEKQVEDALDAHRRRNVGAQHAAPTECEECGEEIPEKRRQAVPGCTRCVDCQQKREWVEGRR